MNREKSSKSNSQGNNPHTINWYPGHMAKALREVQKKVKPVDLVLEIRDARVPLASGNSSLQQMLGQKPRLIVLNKSKLVETGNIRLWDEWFARNNQPALFVDSFETKSLKKLTSTAREIMRTKWQSFRRKGIRPPPLRMIILGIPNTGKSTIINRLTRRNATRTGDRPGVTRSQEWIVLGKDLELLDTPGIMPPRIETEEQGLWLCAIHAIKDEILGKEKVATFVVDYLAGKQSLEFKMKYRLDDLKSEAWELIEQIGIHLNYKKKKGLIDIPKTCGQILQDFRQGLLGTCCFEFPPSPYHQQ